MQACKINIKTQKLTTKTSCFSYKSPLNVANVVSHQTN